MTPRRARLVRLSVAIALAVLVLDPGLGAAPVGAQADEVSAAELQGLIDAAVEDPSALQDLRGVRSVDGRAVDLGPVLDDVSGVALRDRLDALRREVADGTQVDGRTAPEGDAAELAREVLDDPKFDEQQLPRPFKGVLERLADLLRPVGRALEPLTDLFADLPGGGFLLAGAAGLVIGAVGWLLARRRSDAAVRGGDPETWHLVDPTADPDELDRRADAARAEGEHAVEVRLRYESGLLRLAAQGRIDLRPQTTAATVAAQLDEPVITALTRTFEAVVYGGREASQDDADEARDRWPELLAVGSRR